MSSQADILNLAVQKLSNAAGGITLSDTSSAARALSLCYEAVRRAELRKHPWNFAKRPVRLAALTSIPPFTFGHEFAFPADCLRLVEVVGVDKYELAHNGTIRVIMCDESSIDVWYIFNNEDPAQFDPMFIHVFAGALALQIAPSLTEMSAAMLDQLGKWYKSDSDAAKMVDATENPPITFDDGSWAQARSNV